MMKPHELLAIIIARLERDGHDCNRFAFMLSPSPCGSMRSLIIDTRPNEDGLGHEVQITFTAQDEVKGLPEMAEAIARHVFARMHRAVTEKAS